MNIFYVILRNNLNFMCCVISMTLDIVMQFLFLLSTSGRHVNHCLVVLVGPNIPSGHSCSVLR